MEDTLLDHHHGGPHKDPEEERSVDFSTYRLYEDEVRPERKGKKQDMIVWEGHQFSPLEYLLFAYVGLVAIPFIVAFGVGGGIAYGVNEAEQQLKKLWYTKFLGKEVKRVEFDKDHSFPHYKVVE